MGQLSTLSSRKLEQIRDGEDPELFLPVSTLRRSKYVNKAIKYAFVASE
jgi:hypothetical protein